MDIIVVLYEPNKSTIPKREQTLTQSIKVAKIQNRKASMKSTRKRKEFFLSKFNMKL